MSRQQQPLHVPPAVMPQPGLYEGGQPQLGDSSRGSLAALLPGLPSLPGVAALPGAVPACLQGHYVLQVLGRKNYKREL